MKVPEWLPAHRPRDKAASNQLLQWGSNITPVCSLLLVGSRAGLASCPSGASAAKVRLGSLLFTNLQLKRFSGEELVMPIVEGFSAGMGVYQGGFEEFGAAAAGGGAAAAAGAEGGCSDQPPSSTGAARGQPNPAACGDGTVPPVPLMDMDYSSFVVSPLTARAVAAYRYARDRRLLLLGLTSAAAAAAASSAEGAPGTSNPTAHPAFAPSAVPGSFGASADGMNEDSASGSAGVTRQRWQLLLAKRLQKRAADYALFLLSQQRQLQRLRQETGWFSSSTPMEEYEFMYNCLLVNEASAKGDVLSTLTTPLAGSPAAMSCTAVSSPVRLPQHRLRARLTSLHTSNRGLSTSDSIGTGSGYEFGSPKRYLPGQAGVLSMRRRAGTAAAAQRGFGSFGSFDSTGSNSGNRGRGIGSGGAGYTSDPAAYGGSAAPPSPSHVRSQLSLNLRRRRVSGEASAGGASQLRRVTSGRQSTGGDEDATLQNIGVLRMFRDMRARSVAMVRRRGTGAGSNAPGGMPPPTVPPPMDPTETKSLTEQLTTAVGRAVSAGSELLGVGVGGLAATDGGQGGQGARVGGESSSWDGWKAWFVPTGGKAVNQDGRFSPAAAGGRGVGVNGGGRGPFRGSAAGHRHTESVAQQSSASAQGLPEQQDWLDFVDRYIQVSWSEDLGGRPCADAWSPWAHPQVAASYQLASPASPVAATGEAAGGVKRGASDGSGSGDVPSGRGRASGERPFPEVLNLSVAQLKVIMGGHTLAMMLQLAGSVLPVSVTLQLLLERRN